MPAVFLLAATQTYSGVMVDNLCISKGKGFDDVSIYVKKSSGGFDIYKLDKKGNDLAAQLLKNTKKTDNYVVSMTGTLSGDVLIVDSIKEAN